MIKVLFSLVSVGIICTISWRSLRFGTFKCQNESLLTVDSMGKHANKEFVPYAFSLHTSFPHQHGLQEIQFLQWVYGMAMWIRKGGQYFCYTLYTSYTIPSFHRQGTAVMFHYLQHLMKLYCVNLSYTENTSLKKCVIYCRKHLH